jgi:microcystin degradation protein MlrC
MKVITAEIYHETNTFSCRYTDQQAFRDRFFLLDSDAVDERGKANTELAGFLSAGNRHGWQVDHVLSASAGPGGKVTSAAFEWLCGPVLSAVKNKNYDGILLGLHGAMVTDLYDDGEGELLQRLRNLVGSEIPIAITLDLHANVTRRMCALADIIVSYKTYPHVDMFDAGVQAGDILNRAMNREIKPSTILASVPMLEEANGGRTDIGPMIDRISRARSCEMQDDVFAVSINAGFPNADTAEIGPTVLVTCQGDFPAHCRIAESIANDMWMRRHEVLNEYLGVEEAAAIAALYVPANGPLIVADYADNPGAGAYGDATDLLRALLDAGVTDACFGPLVDGETVQVLLSGKPGDRISIELGGKTDPRFGGKPLSLDAELLSTSDGRYIGDGPMMDGLQGSFGPSAVVRVEGIEILVVTIPGQMLDLQQFKTFGIDPRKKRVIALKSMQHFRAAFEPVAGEIIVCDSGALCTLHYEIFSYRQVPRPIFPLDEMLHRESVETSYIAE